MEILYLLPLFTLPLIFSIIRIIKGNLSRENWVIIFINILIALLGITLVFFPPSQDDKNKPIWWSIIVTSSILSPILTHLYFRRLSSKSVVYKFKKSIILDGKIQYFKSRHDLDLYEYLSRAEKDIIFVSLTNEIISKDVNLNNLIRYLIMDKNISIRFLVLDPNSSIVDKICSFFGLDEKEFKKTIIETLTNLSQLKKGLTNNRELMQIETYNSDLQNSLIIIDHDTKWKNKFTSIKIEQYIMGSDNIGSRPSYIVFLKNNKSYYTKCFKDYSDLGKTKNYA